ncbi:hypothetical protein CH276_23555 [Rhodococcus sp. 06-470-2]|uniref:hypothetical protein n=1 Tax=unclassified Rhodococcus (in: high G+C Gram-positive bacteria) TaxID=192944 RepID=UPI000B9BAC62|nr:MULTISPECIES: hypothetical protein [unclassified Rhodococcus (in: high G+C Gram-positive bacteria)]OZC57953.1 hypothetical protein CH276_23555 [Rhodococcus sp. 06-470-2]OZE10989.1 hypothetical protein CH250_10880 [Rhodococcus sp. 05-2255-3C]OZE14144.1 hypothetical protein CH249_06825 [Rhodococcus sp. 05-2255-3B1]OZE24716.1 hypothetical protein CH255_00700 [Rhodococcus sp. 05-2255-2A2]OZE54966.1 hypothetical protein CH265_27110 [Rhodococcus sp. 05-2221-1B]
MPAETATSSATAEPSTALEVESQQESTVAPPTRTPEEAADLVPGGGGAILQPSGDEPGNVDPATFRTGGGQYNFVSPTGNIHCGIWDADGPEGRVGCQAVDGRNPFEGPQCSNAENDKVAVRVTGAGPENLCTTQGIYVNANAPVLEFGQVLSAEGVVCESGPDDIVACTAPAGGFTFSRGINYTY